MKQGSDAIGNWWQFQRLAQESSCQTLAGGGQCFLGLVTRRHDRAAAGKTTTSNHQSTTGNQQEWLFDPLTYLFSLSSKMGEAYPIQEALAQDW